MLVSVLSYIFELDLFLDFTPAIVDMTKQHVAKANNSTIENYMALTSEDILKSVELQENTSIQNDLQAKVGTLSVFLESMPSDGGTKSLTQLMKEAQHKRTVSPHKLKSHLDSEVTDVIIVTPSKSLGNIIIVGGIVKD